MQKKDDEFVDKYFTRKGDHELLTQYRNLRDTNDDGVNNKAIRRILERLGSRRMETVYDYRTVSYIQEALASIKQTLQLGKRANKKLTEKQKEDARETLSLKVEEKVFEVVSYAFKEYTKLKENGDPIPPEFSWIPDFENLYLATIAGQDELIQKIKEGGVTAILEYGNIKTMISKTKFKVNANVFDNNKKLYRDVNLKTEYNARDFTQYEKDLFFLLKYESLKYFNKTDKEIIQDVSLFYEKYPIVSFSNLDQDRPLPEEGYKLLDDNTTTSKQRKVLKWLIQKNYYTLTDERETSEMTITDFDDFLKKIKSDKSFNIDVTLPGVSEIITFDSSEMLRYNTRRINFVDEFFAIAEKTDFDVNAQFVKGDCPVCKKLRTKENKNKEVFEYLPEENVYRCKREHDAMIRYNTELNAGKILEDPENIKKLQEEGRYIEKQTKNLVKPREPTRIPRFQFILNHIISSEMLSEGALSMAYNTYEIIAKNPDAYKTVGFAVFKTRKYILLDEYPDFFDQIFSSIDDISEGNIKEYLSKNKIYTEDRETTDDISNISTAFKDFMKKMSAAKKKVIIKRLNIIQGEVIEDEDEEEDIEDDEEEEKPKKKKSAAEEFELIDPSRYKYPETTLDGIIFPDGKVIFQNIPRKTNRKGEYDDYLTGEDVPVYTRLIRPGMIKLKTYDHIPAPPPRHVNKIEKSQAPEHLNDPLSMHSESKLRDYIVHIYTKIAGKQHKENIQKYEERVFNLYKNNGNVREYLYEILSPYIFFYSPLNEVEKEFIEAFKTGENKFTNFLDCKFKVEPQLSHIKFNIDLIDYLLEKAVYIALYEYNIELHPETRVYSTNIKFDRRFILKFIEGKYQSVLEHKTFKELLADFE